MLKKINPEHAEELLKQNEPEAKEIALAIELFTDGSLNTFAKNGVLGFSQCFLMAAILCAIGGVWFILGWKFLGDAGKRPFKEGVQTEKVETKDKTPLTTKEKKRILAIVLVSLFSVLFWVFWY